MDRPKEDPLASRVLSRADAMTADERKTYFDRLELAETYREGRVSRRSRASLGPPEGWRERIRRRIKQLSADSRDKLLADDIGVLTTASGPQGEGELAKPSPVPDQSPPNNFPSQPSGEHENLIKHRLSTFYRFSLATLLVATFLATSALLPNILSPRFFPRIVNLAISGSQRSEVYLDFDSAGNWNFQLYSNYTRFDSVSRNQINADQPWESCPIENPDKAVQPWRACGWYGLGIVEGAGEYAVSLPSVWETSTNHYVRQLTYTVTMPGTRADVSGVIPEPTSVEEMSGSVTYTWKNPLVSPQLYYSSPGAKRNAQVSATLLTLTLGFLVAAIFQILPELIRRGPAQKTSRRTVFEGVAAAAALGLPYLENNGLLSHAQIDVHYATLVVILTLLLLRLAWPTVLGILARVRLLGGGNKGPVLAVRSPAPERHGWLLVPKATALTVTGVLCGLFAAGASAMLEASNLPVSQDVWSWPTIGLFVVGAVAKQGARIAAVLCVFRLIQSYLRPVLAIALIAAVTAITETGSLAPVGLFMGGGMEVHRPDWLITACLAAALGVTLLVWTRWRRAGLTAVVWGFLALVVAFVATWHAQFLNPPQV